MTCEARPDLNDEKLFAMVRAKDKLNILTKDLQGDNAPPSAQTKMAEGMFRQGWHWCSLCPRRFKDLKALQQHMASAAHRPNLYRCPSQWCTAEFKKLSAVINHLESGACGYVKPRQVHKFVRDILTKKNRVIYRPRRRVRRAGGPEERHEAVSR
ncbi:hypothetical protein VTJ83DRAFT_3289 [Remersonia thermophila]|uniref:C2H2-type domain-containing protein n=1 Tax=Remersonia thermophila TaxID=72144 RepID=A0ABR4DDL1_9PEZI